MSQDNKHKHLELIQSVIERMAANSFHVKGWSVAVVSALLAVSLSKEETRFATLSLFPLLMFWGLDGYYLSLEKGFRSVYERVRKLDDDSIDFSMHRSRDEQGWKHWLDATFCSVNAVFHVVAVIVSITVSVVVSKIGC